MSETHSQKPHSDLFVGNSDMSALMRTIDWANTPLGPVQQWPQSLQTAVSICLLSRFPIHIWWGPDLIEIYNDAYRPILGTTKHPAAMGQRGQDTWAEIWHIIGPMLESVYRDGKATWSEDQMLPIDRHGFTEETYFTFSYSPIFDESGGIGGIFTAVTETTKRVLSERRLRTLRLVGERAGTAKTAHDACQMITSILEGNPADIPFAFIYLLNEAQDTAVLTSYTGQKQALTEGLEALPLSDTAAVWPLAQVTDPETNVLIEHLEERFTTLPIGPGPERIQRALVLPVVASASRKVTGYLVVGLSPHLLFDDSYKGFFKLVAGHISTAVANARAYEEERRRVEALAALDRAKTEFFSNISHEFRTPLTLLLNPLEEILSDDSSPLTTAQRDILETVQRNGLRLHKLVNSLLDFSRIQANRIEASYEPTDLSALTTDLVSTFRTVVERAGLRLLVDCPPLPEPVYVDHEMWEKIILNLLSNAFKFTFEGEIEVIVRPVGNDVHVTVRDTGIGIAAQDLEHIFDRFQRVRGARSRTYEGSGIGLALVHELVRFHGGEIRVESEVDVGTIFTLILQRGTSHLPQDQVGSPRLLSSTMTGAAPYVQEALRWVSDVKETSEISTLMSLSEVVQPVSSANDGVQILVVDDNADMRDYLARLLSPYYQVILAEDGAVALSIIERQLPDLVLTDVMMPHLDGFGLLSWVRRNLRTRFLPVILLSARAGEEARIEGLKAGADDYLIKPFSTRELLASIEGNLKIARLRHELVEQETSARLETEALIESIADPFYALDRDWRFIYVNRSAAMMWGKTQAELLQKNIWEMFPQGVDTDAYSQMQKTMETQQPGAFETFSAFLKSWFEVNLYPSSRGLAIYFRDINARKDTEQLRIRLELVINNLDGEFILLDREGHYIYANHAARAAAEARTGLPVEQVTLDSVFPEKISPRLYEEMRQASKERSPRVFEHYDETRQTWTEYRLYPSLAEENLALFTLDITNRKHVAEALQRSEARLQAMFDQAVVGIAFVRTDGQIMQANPGFCAMLGYSVDEIVRLTIKDVTYPDDYGVDMSLANQVLKGDISSYSLEKRYIRKDQNIIWVNLTSSLVRTAAGEPDYALAIVEDITEQKQAQEAAQIIQSQLENERGRIVNIFESISDAFVALDRDFRFTYLNPQAADMYDRLIGQPQDYFIGRTVWDVFPGSYESPFGEAYQRAMRENVFLSLEAYFPPLEAWFEVRVYPSKDGLSIYFADVTDAHKARIALRTAEDRLRLIMDSAKDYAIFAFDQQGQITDWNAGSERIFGYTAEEILGQPEALLYMPADVAAHIPERERDKAAQVGYAENERWHRRKDGRLFYASGMVRPIRSESGDLQGFTKVARDTTQHKLAVERTQLLQRLASDLSAHLMTHDMAETIMQYSMEAVGGTMSSIFLLRPENQTLERFVTEGFSQTTQKSYAQLPLNVSYPVTDAVRMRQLIEIHTQADYIARYPHIQETVRRDNIHATLSLPLILETHVLGVLNISFNYEKVISADERELLITVAHLCAQALERARLYEQAQAVATLRERQRLARDLHDAVNQTLFSAMIIAESLPRLWERNPDKVFPLLQQVHTLNKAAGAEMRVLLWELRPEALEKTPLEDLYAQLANAIQGRRQMEVALDLQLDAPLSLPLTVHVAFYRIAQEAINNVVKHSQAKHLSLHLKSLIGRVTLDIVDDGIGFDETPTFGIGMGSMRERADEINATLNITSRPKEGTRVSLVWERRL